MRVLVAAIPCVLASSLAAAQPASVQAEALFRQGKTLMGEKKYAEACSAFAGSHQIDPSVATLLNLADCREKNGQLATAWGHFLDAERQTRSASDAASKAMNATATRRSTALEPRLSKLTIAVGPARQLAGLEVLRDGARVEPSTFDSALPIDGGTYQITARAPGHTEWSTSIVVKPERDAQVVEIPALEAAAATPPPAPDVAAPVAPAPRHAGAPGGEGRSLVVPIVLGVSALALGGGAFYFNQRGGELYDRSLVEADDAKQEQLWQSANKRRYAAIGLGVAAVGCVGAAIFVYVRGGASEPRPATALRVEPVVGRDGGGLALTGGW